TRGLYPPHLVVSICRGKVCRAILPLDGRGGKHGRTTRKPSTILRRKTRQQTRGVEARAKTRSPYRLHPAPTVCRSVHRGGASTTREPEHPPPYRARSFRPARRGGVPLAAPRRGSDRLRPRFRYTQTRAGGDGKLGGANRRGAGDPRRLRPERRPLR